MVPFRGRGTSFEPSVMDPGEVDRSLRDPVETGTRVSPIPAGIGNVDSCLGGNGGGLRTTSVESISAIGLSSMPSSPSGRTE
jgi:hypothetical protein